MKSSSIVFEDERKDDPFGSRAFRIIELRIEAERRKKVTDCNVSGLLLVLGSEIGWSGRNREMTRIVSEERKRAIHESE